MSTIEFETEAPARPLPTALLIDGQFLDGVGDTIDIPNPATAQILQSVPMATIEQCDAAIEAARRAFTRGFKAGTWTDPAFRAACLHQLADRMQARRDELIRVIVDELGTPVTISEGLQVDAPIQILRWYADATTIDRGEDLGIAAGPPSSHSLVAYRAAGVVAAITAYNYPILLAANKIGPALAAGCTVVLMPSPLAPLSTLLLAEIIAECDFPAGVVNVIVGGADVGQRLTVHPVIAKVSFTGSVAVGRMVMAQAALGIKDVILELGGKSPGIVLPGTDLSTVMMPLHARYLRNAGQGCQSPTRLLVHEAQYDEFLERSRETYDQIGVGDPWDHANVVGPVIRPEHQARIQAFIEGAVADGATIVAEGHLPDGPGWYVRPTLIANVSNSSRIAREEIFGPVAVVLPYRDIDHMIEIANDTELGLHAALFGDPDECRALAPLLEAGNISINGGGGIRPDAPLGGFKQSSIGRECGEWGIREFLEPQHIQWPEG